MTRLVHLELSTQRGVAVWLFEARSNERPERVGNQTGGAPLDVFYTGDCRGMAGERREQDVAVGDLRETPEDVSVYFEDRTAIGLCSWNWRSSGFQSRAESHSGATAG